MPGQISVSVLSWIVAREQIIYYFQRLNHNSATLRAILWWGFALIGLAKPANFLITVANNFD
jgi:hypothetical protein